MEITEIYSHTFLTKISWKQRFFWWSYYKELISRDKISVRENFAFFIHCTYILCNLDKNFVKLSWSIWWKNAENTYFSKKIPWKQRSYHTVEITGTHCGNLRIFPPRFFCKNFVKLNISLKSYTVNQLDENFSHWGKISEISTLWGILSHAVLAKFPWK